MDDKRFRLDFVIALCAVLISAVAAGASAYQTYVINQQFSATVWPYLSLGTDSDRQGHYWELHLRNDGLGPALIRSTTVTLDGKPVNLGPDQNAVDTAIQPAIDAARAEVKKAHAHGIIHTTSSSLGPGDVVSANSGVTLLRVEGPPLVQRVRKLVPRIDVSLCYCSLLGQCWIRSFSNASSEPQSVRSCPTAG